MLVLTPEVIARFLIVTVPMAVIAAVTGMWTWLALRFRVDGDDLVVETGLLRKNKRRIPLSRIQAIDVVRPLVTRVFALAEVRVELAGGEQSEISLRYLGHHSAKQLRAELLALAAGLPGHTPEAPNGTCGASPSASCSRLCCSGCPCSARFCSSSRP